MLYDSSETVGYAAARLPGCYSVVWRVLDEIDVRVPDFQPRSMLDFGAGPGTAIWAASEVHISQDARTLLLVLMHVERHQQCRSCIPREFSSS